MIAPAPRERAASGWRGRLATVAAIAVLVMVPLVPGVLATGSASGLVRLPVESLVILLLLALVPWRIPRLMLAGLFGVFVGVAVVLAAIDLGYRLTLGTHFVALDWPQLGDAFGVVVSSIGAGAANALLTGIVLVIVGMCVALAWSALRTDALLRRRSRGRIVLSAATAAWIVAAAIAPPLSVADPVAAAASTGSIGSAVSRAVTTLQRQAAVARAIRDDPFADVPSSQLLTALRGKDVVIAFVESYGRVALEGTSFSRGVASVLQDGDAALAADGYRTQSAWLTSPTFGGVSWLAHSTFQTGIWIDAQSVYGQVVASDRLTLAEAFHRAGWRTVADVPSNTKPWPVGTSFYHYDTLLNATDVGYRGPRFGYARIPDQYTLKHFADRELAGAHQPVMAEIDLVSSHTPWAPLPTLVPWERIGDGSIYADQPARSEPASVVWDDPRTVQKYYGMSVEYSLGSLFSFLQNVDDPNLVVIVLGDHQPATIVSGADAGHDVPISIIAKDPAVFDAIAPWAWQPGLHPGDAAPVWRMDAFRDAFLTAFGAPR